MGRDADCDIQLIHDEVSDRHVRLIASHRSLQVIDLQSHSGTWLNGARIVSADLVSGCQLRVGPFLLDVSRPSDALKETILQSAAFDTSTDFDDTPGIDGYSALTFLGRGRFGVVYRAKQLGTERDVAIKILTAENGHTERLQQMFFREASIAVQLKHARIVECLGFGICGRFPYLVMEYLAAENLESIAARQSTLRRVRLAVRVAIQVLEALDYAHQQGVVHRDIKPANLLATVHGRRLRLKVADFGLAKFYRTAGYSGITDSDDLCGTLYYMSPEQIADSRSATPACDVYATLVCLYRLLTGQFPHPTLETIDFIDYRLTQSGIPTQQVSPDVPLELAWLIDRGLSANRTQRFTNAAALLVELKSMAFPGPSAEGRSVIDRSNGRLDGSAGGTTKGRSTDEA